MEKGQLRPATRLDVLASFVGPGDVPADIGTDHARLPIELVRTRRCPHAIASDRSPRALAGARRAVLRAGVEDRVELRLADGFDALDSRTVTTVVLSGFGTRSMIAILERGGAKLGAIGHLVLAPNRDVSLLRGWLAAARWRLTNERVVEERGTFYWVLSAEPERAGDRRLDPLDVALGPIARHRDDVTYGRYAERERERIRGAMEAIGSSPASRARERLDRLAAQLDALGPVSRRGDRCTRAF